MSNNVFVYCEIEMRKMMKTVTSGKIPQMAQMMRGGGGRRPF